MSTTFYDISETEMTDFLGGQGFKPMAVEGVTERVYGKKVGTDLCLRVYSGVQDGNSRGVGKDAIRVVLYWRDKDGRVFKVAGSKRVNRVASWGKNLQNRIDTWNEMLVSRQCPCCGAPMRVQKVRKQGPRFGQEFLSCVTWSVTKCPGTIWE